MNTALELIIQEVDEKIRNLQEAIASGSAKDYAEYQRMCGVIQGLLATRLYTADLKQTMESSDD
jgi:hypothetical protein